MALLPTLFNYEKTWVLYNREYAHKRGYCLYKYKALTLVKCATTILDVYHFKWCPPRKKYLNAIVVLHTTDCFIVLQLSEGRLTHNATECQNKSTSYEEEKFPFFRHDMHESKKVQ